MKPVEVTTAITWMPRDKQFIYNGTRYKLVVQIYFLVVVEACLNNLRATK